MFMAIVCAGVLRAAQAGFDHREPGLHEHDQEAGDQHPHHVDREQVVGDAVVETGNRRRAAGSSSPGDADRRRPIAGAGRRSGSGHFAGLTFGDRAAVVVRQMRGLQAASAAAARLQRLRAVSCALVQFPAITPTASDAATNTSGRQNFRGLACFFRPITIVSLSRRMEMRIGTCRARITTVVRRGGR